MPIIFYCSSCGKKLKAPDASAGRRVPCPKCGAPIDVPGGEEEEDAFDSMVADISEKARKAGKGLMAGLRQHLDGAKRKLRRRPARR